MDLGYTHARRLFAIDYSTSVTNNSFYYGQVEAIVTKNIRRNDAVILWDHSYREITGEELSRVIGSRSGGGGTSPVAIAEAVATLGSDVAWHLVLVTDGQVGVTSIDQCDSFIAERNLQFRYVSAFIIGEEGNLSVVCPFTRSCSHAVWAIRPSGTEISRIEVARVSDADLALVDRLSEIKTVPEFDASFEGLSRSLTARTLGTVGDRRLRNEVIDLQNRIARSLGSGVENIGPQMREALESGRLPEALEYGAQLVAGHVVPPGLSAKIHGLIRLCEGALRLTFDVGSIQTARAERARPALEADALDVATAPTTVASFVCPISYEDETDPVILVVAPEQPLLFKVGPKTVTQMLDCPLNGLLKHHFMDSFAALLDHPLSLRSMREAASSRSPITTSPITRRKLIGAIPLGGAKSHVEAADWTLSRILSGGKALGNADLWFALLWMAIEDGRAPHLAEMLPFIREQMLWRLCFRYSTAAVTGLSGFVQRRIPLGCAIWFCLASPAFRIHPAVSYDPLRLHLPHINIMRRLLDLAGYPLPDGIVRHVKRLRALFALLAFSKWNHTDLQALLRGLRQRWLYVDRRKVHRDLFDRADQVAMYVPIDGVPTDHQLEIVRENLPRRCVGLTNEELIGLGSLVNPNIAASAIELPVEWNPPRVRQAAVEWALYDGRLESFGRIEICPSTMRPFARLNDGRSWRDALAEVIESEGELAEDQIFSGHRWYGRFVCATRHYPNAEEMIEFIFNRVIVRGDRVALMQDIRNFADLICGQYAKVIVGVPAGVFIWRFTRSAALESRMKMEGESPQNRMIDESGNVEKDAKPPKGKKKLEKKKHTSANEQRQLRGHGSAKAKDKAGRAK
jgi:hypothetical protein